MVQNNLGDSLSNTIERILTANELSVSYSHRRFCPGVVV